METDMHLRKARTGDVHAIYDILTHYAKQGLLLQRPLSELYDHLRDYVVLECSEAGQTPGSFSGLELVGVCGLGVCWEDLAEVRSLAVLEAYRDRGLGLKLVEACLEEARVLGLKRVFTLTYVPDFFGKIGFQVVDKAVLPHKVWADCLKCPKFPDCDEIAMMRAL